LIKVILSTCLHGEDVNKSFRQRCFYNVSVPLIMISTRCRPNGT